MSRGSRFTLEQISSMPSRIQKQIYVEGSEYWTPEEVAAVTVAYQAPDGFDITTLAKKLNRSHASIACKAHHLGLTGRRGEHTRTAAARANGSKAQQERMSRPGVKELISQNVKALWKRQPHPRGMLGKHHTEEAKAAISAGNYGRKHSAAQVLKRMQTKCANAGQVGSPTGRAGCTWKQGWREVNGVRIFFRSRWEFNYALYLDFLRRVGKLILWEHEPETFWFEKVRRGTRSYLPDFKVQLTNGSFEYHEVKGWMDARSKTKLKRMAKYHPKVVLRIIRADWFRTVGRQMRGLLPGWEK